ncbi:MAG TPA: amidase family protein, partial [Terrimesophilobacter sp.]|nr:amidase family protein [Terrimesophilobacter sp.]
MTSTPATPSDPRLKSATDIIRAAQTGTRTPLDIAEAAIERAHAAARYDAIHELFAEEARAEAKRLGDRDDLAALPLAGLPVLIKDNIPVSGHPLRVGSRATSAAAADHDHEVVRRLRDAGAIILGTTRVPELCVFGTTDSHYGHVTNPWNPDHAPGGSSGGASAAVAAGIVPVAHAADGMGSIRIPAAATGTFGIKPGRGTVPAGMGHDSWGGMSENGVIAHRVADAALTLSVMAADPTLASVTEPPHPLRIAVATNTPSFLVSVTRPWREAVNRTADALRAAGHEVTVLKYPYPANPIPLFARWFSGVASDAHDLDHARLEPRTRRHVKLGLRAQRRGWVRPADADREDAKARALFASHDVIMTPTLARRPPLAHAWHKRSWFANIWSN